VRSQKEKMLAGELYDPLDPQLVAGRRRARLLFKTRDVPGGVFAAGNPCRVVREVGE
jgi:hypothetical protein